MTNNLSINIQHQISTPILGLLNRRISWHGTECPVSFWFHPGVPRDRDGTKFFFMGWDGTKISVGWELPVPRQARTGTGWDKILVGWELPSRSRSQPRYED